MLISLSWLKKFIPIDIDPYDLALKLTMAGIEATVEDGEWGKGWEDIVVAEITEIAPFPGKEGKLVTGKLNIGTEEISIVSADVTLGKGEKVLAVPAGKFFNGKKVDSRKFGDFLSSAMLIAGEELGWEEKSTAILRFSDDLNPGTPLSSIITIPDAIIELEITPNRGDCLSHLGVAREIKAILGIEEDIHSPSAEIEEVEPPSSDFISVFIDNPEMGPYYTGRYISNIKIGPSPLNIQAELAKVGVRSISNVVDITNYVLMEIGQPLHAFDASLVKDKTIRVRSARKDERILLLDGTERVLDEKDLVIADSKDPVALAGIMGGEKSGVNENTREVILESAYFNPVTIRHTARKLGIQTDASYRFERGVDPDLVEYASNRAAYLIQKYAGGKVHKGLVKAGELSKTSREIFLSWEKQKRLLGIDIDNKKTEKILSLLGCDILKDDDEGITVKTPSWRHDLERDVDLIEEVARIYGYNEIPTTFPTIRVKEFSPLPEMIRSLKPREFLPQWGFHEVINYSFISPNEVDLLNLPENHWRRNFIKIINPLTNEQSVMRTSLIPSLLENVRINLSMQFTDLRLFEIGKIYWKDGESFKEEFYVGLIMTGRRFLPHWGWQDKNIDFYDLKGIMESLFTRFNFKNIEWDDGKLPYFHPYQQAELFYKEEKIGEMGQLHPSILGMRKIRQAVYYGEINLTRVFSLGSEKISYEKVSKFPAAERDLAIVVDEDFPVGEILKIARESIGDVAWDVRIFDLYRGNNIPEGKKSVGIRFYLQSLDHTLSEEEISDKMNNVLKALEKIGGKLRS